MKHPGLNHQFGAACAFRALRFVFVILAATLAFYPAALHGQIKLWGLGAEGGNGAGGILSLNTDGSDFESYPLPVLQGASPQGDLLQAANGKFYGLTYSGGSSYGGVLFEYDPSGGGTYSVLHNFVSATGRNPNGSLVETGGKFYGMTLSGGSSNVGVLFEYDPTGGGTYSVLHNFVSATGRNPNGSLVETGGKFYGMTNSGGSSNVGVLFEYDPTGGGTYSVLHNFVSATGRNPYGSLVETGGKFYGMTSRGGSLNVGVLFEYDPTGGGMYSVLHNFSSATGTSPRGSLVETGGKFYGMTISGGSSGAGVLFEYDPTGGGTYSVLHNFSSATGTSPRGSLVETGGKFYGMTNSGGSSGAGVLFEYDPTGGGTYSVLHNFVSATGRNPHGSLVKTGGKFYGMTNSGGSSNSGVLFEYDPSGGGPYSVLIDFDAASTGRNPKGSLVETGGKFYGMTNYGGSLSYGVLFEYDPSGGGTYSVLHEFDYTNGGYPYGSLVETGGKFYGMTSESGISGGGVLFEYDPSGGGTYSVLHEFDYTNGGYPYGSLVESGGKFYGMTSYGGSLGYGVIFEYDPSGGGTYSVLHNFENTNGSYPYGSLVELDGKFYGMTNEGGSSGGYGVIFEYDPSGGGTYSVLHEFDYTDGGFPYGSLVELDGKFYGMTSGGGSSGGYGVIFEYDPSGGGTYTVLHEFDYTNGASPSGSLIETGGKFYGMTNSGGSSNGGVVFEYDPTGSTYSVLKELQYPSEVIKPFLGSLIAVATSPEFSGSIKWEHMTSSGVENATVNLTGAGTGSDLTDASGDYQISIPDISGSFELRPEKNINYNNGLMVNDALAIQQHLTGNLPITNAFKMIAADVNCSNSVSTFDALLIKQGLLSNPQVSAFFTKSWRFVPQSWTPVLPPWGFPEAIELTSVTTDQFNQDFYGIKIGDLVANFADPANFGGGSNSPAPLVLRAEDRLLEQGEPLVVTVTANAFDDLAAWQFGLHFGHGTCNSTVWKSSRAVFCRWQKVISVCLVLRRVKFGRYGRNPRG
ncbi:MAG: hypothetical protein R3D58_02360 [Saprospiraceae bacterium]